jgi:hypothetical protein
MKNFEHSAYALLFMAIVGLLTGNWFAGACFGSAFFIGREITQAEYRNIEHNYGGKRANMPWYGGFQKQAWTAKGLLDWILPTVAVIALAFFIE